MYDPEGPNKSWTKWTPSGEVKLDITNPEALKEFEVGKFYGSTFEKLEG